jgi:septal ring factor EnvC (AmiA/AmiB activator)
MLAPGALAWEQADEATMEKAQVDLPTLKKQGDELQRECAETSTTLKSINETLRSLNTWVPHVDESIKGIQQSLEAVGQRLTMLEGDKGKQAETPMPAAEVYEGDPSQQTGALPRILIRIQRIHNF